MQWTELKARILASGGAKLEGAPADEFIAKSTAGPGAGGIGAVFFREGNHRVKLAVNPNAGSTLVHLGSGKARLIFEGQEYSGELDLVGHHCPRQAFITVSSGCIFHCRYCPVPSQRERRRKPVDEIVAMVEPVLDRVDAISLTSGVLDTIEEEEHYVLEVVAALRRFDLPIGVTIYPLPETPSRLYALGVAEVKFNVEAATPVLFGEMCPGLDRQAILGALDHSILLFGKNHVFSNVLIGLGETDEEMKTCIRDLTGMGVIPELRPLNPAAGLKDYPRPSAERLLRLHTFLSQELDAAGLDPRQAQTMCTACQGCDLIHLRDDA
ncbi:MAG: radical SAM protein [Methanoregulaceae archaeon]